MGTNPRLKALLARLREETPKGYLLHTIAMRMQRDIFLEEVENKYPPFRGVVEWIPLTKEVKNVQAQTKEEV